MKKTNRLYIHKFVVTCQIECMWATADSYRYTRKLNLAENDEGAIINIIHAVSYMRGCYADIMSELLVSNEAEFTNFIRMNEATFNIPLVLGTQNTKLRLVILSQEEL